MIIKKKGKAVFIQRQFSKYCIPDIIMITVFHQNDNPLNQNTYDEIIDDIDICSIECPSCHHHGTMIRYGRYPRTVKLSCGEITITVQRVYCNSCHKTHALLLVDFVPYSQILLEDHISIITNDDDKEVLEDNPSLTPRDLHYVRSQYNKYWKERILSLHSVIDEDIFSDAFRFFNMQFMQIKCKVNILFDPANITSVY